MWAILNRIVLASGISLAVFMQGAVPETAMAQATQPKESSKVADVIHEMMYSCYEALATGATDLSELSNSLLHVSPAGQIELLFHSKTPTGDAEAQDLSDLGATVVGGLEFPPELDLDLPQIGMIQAWVPYDIVEEAANLDWVVAVTPPGYGDVDPHPTNPIDSEGVPIHNADLLQMQGVDGTGVTVEPCATRCQRIDRTSSGYSALSPHAATAFRIARK